MALIACGIGHADVKVIEIRFPVWSLDILEGINVKAGCYLITDNTDYLEVDYGKRWVYHDSTEHLVVYVPVQIFHQLLVGESTAQVPVRQACGFCHIIKRKQRMKPTKLTLMKTLAIVFQNIKFWKTQSRVNSWNILYLHHILVWIFPPFWPSNLIFGGIPKDTKKPTNSQYFVYELVGWFCNI